MENVFTLAFSENRPSAPLKIEKGYQRIFRTNIFFYQSDFVSLHNDNQQCQQFSLLKIHLPNWGLNNAIRGGFIICKDPCRHIIVDKQYLQNVIYNRTVHKELLKRPIKYIKMYITLGKGV